MQYKIGDEVVLRPETKPYTFKLDRGNKKVVDGFEDNKIYKISYIHSDGDVAIVCDEEDHSNISPHHLKHAKENTAFEDWHEEIYKNHSDSFNDLESDVQAELEKFKDIDLVELRLSIFNGDTSRTLEEMKAIEAWLLGESK